VSTRPPGSSPPDRGTQRAHAFWRASAPFMFAATLLFGLAAAIGGPIVLYQLIVRGLREGRASWFALGVICAIPWLLVVYAALKKALVRKPPSDPPERR
jgi:hypothetical protein